MKTSIVLGILYDKGEIIKLVDVGEYYSKFIFKNNVGDKFLLYVEKEYLIYEGTEVLINGRLELPSKQRNRGGFDYSKYMYSQGMYGSIYIEDTNNIEIIETNKFHLISNIQRNILDSFKKFLPKEQLGIVLGMIIGDSSYISEETKESFKQSGITHLLAVSGSNVTYIILITKFLFKKICGKSFSNYITIFMIILFVLISGASPSVVRAGIMAIILILSDIFARQPSIAATISVTAILILLYNPLIVCDVGFILSFGGTVGIVLLNSKLITYFNHKFNVSANNRIFKVILEVFTVTLSAQLMLTPVMWYFFNNISTVSLLTNLLVGPFVGYITILGIAVYFSSLIFYPLAKMLSYCTYFLVILVINISKMCASIPYGNLTIPTPSFLMVVTYYLLLYVFYTKVDILMVDNDDDKLGFMLWRKNTLKHMKKIVSILIFIQVVIYILPKGYIEVNMIDVGQGDSVLIKTNNYNILIDGGGSENSSYDVGKNILLPYLLDNTNGRIDAIIISHFHDDHAEGCISVLENLKVEKILIGNQPKMTSLYEKVLKISKEKNIPIITLSCGDTIRIGNISFNVLYPQKELSIAEDLNSNSLIIKMEYFGVSMLFTGDLEMDGEEKLINAVNTRKEKDTLKADILKVAHHGSKTSSSEKFLNLVDPKIALISVGMNNKFGHPNGEVMKRFLDRNCIICRTDECGEISIKIYKNGNIKIYNHMKCIN